MNKLNKSKRPDGIAIIMSGLIYVISLNTGFAKPQQQQLTRAEFSKELTRACYENDEQLAISLVRDNRLLVKPVVNDLIKEGIIMELKGKVKESGQKLQTAEKIATAFKNIFGEKSLTIAVNYLVSWSKEQ